MSKTNSRTRLAAATSVALAGLLVSGLTACSAAPTPAPAPSNSAANQPLFSSDAEALAAATAAYAKYLEVSDQIARDGGANPERLKPFVASTLFDEQRTGYLDVQKNGLHVSGQSKYSAFKIQSTGQSVITAYSCLDVSALRVFNQSNADITPGDRSKKIPLSLSFVQADKNLVVESSNVWTGANFCA